jgi:DNA-binding FrmR family transcriptional regulator
MDPELTPDENARILNRLRRVEGQTRGLQRMIEDGRTCEDVFTQSAAVKASLDRVGVLLISLTMRECLSEHGAETDAQEAVERALEAFVKYAHSATPAAAPPSDSGRRQRPPLWKQSPRRKAARG